MIVSTYAHALPCFRQLRPGPEPIPVTEEENSSANSAMNWSRATQLVYS